jgi:LytS/YehU family sensor histidine kinase
LSGSETVYVLLGRRLGGRRYLSEDLDSLSKLATVVNENVERFRQDEMQRLVSRAELRALQAQINPHFLFNSLNTLYGSIPRENSDARRIVLNLADVFRYFLQSEKTFIPLEQELRIVEAYLEIESLRLGGRLQTEIDVADGTRALLIPILSIQPLVENAVKHGVASKTGGGRVRLRVEAHERGASIRVEDTGYGFQRSMGMKSAGLGVGLDNVRRRLQLCYGPGADLFITSSETGSCVEFLVPPTAGAQCRT